MFKIGDKVKIKKNYSEIGIKKTNERIKNKKDYCGVVGYWKDVTLNTDSEFTILNIDRDGDIVLNCNYGLEFYKEQLEWLEKQANQ